MINDRVNFVNMKLNIIDLNKCRVVFWILVYVNFFWIKI